MTANIREKCTQLGSWAVSKWWKVIAYVRYVGLFSRRYRTIEKDRVGREPEKTQTPSPVDRGHIVSRDEIWTRIAPLTVKAIIVCFNYCTTGQDRICRSIYMGVIHREMESCRQMDVNTRQIRETKNTRAAQRLFPIPYIACVNVIKVAFGSTHNTVKWCRELRKYSTGPWTKMYIPYTVYIYLSNLHQRGSLGFQFLICERSDHAI